MSEISVSTKRLPRSIEIALALTASMWAVAARATAMRAAAGIAWKMRVPSLEPMLDACFLLFLVLIGFTALHWVATRGASVRSVNELPPRATSAFEWRLGAAMGWGIATASVLLLAMTGALHPALWISLRAVWITCVSLCSLALMTLALEAIWRGYILVRLEQATGATTAALLSSAAAAGVSALLPHATRLSVFNVFLFGLLLAMAFFRTRALWLGWGLHFGWAASSALLFGLRLDGSDRYTGIVESSVRGAAWWTGGLYGASANFIFTVAVCAAMFVLYTLTRDLAWQYTAPVLVGAGEPMDVAPPAAHTKMEAATAATPALVQILGATPTESSTMAVVREHLEQQTTQSHE